MGQLLWKTRMEEEKGADLREGEGEAEGDKETPSFKFNIYQ